MRDRDVGSLRIHGRTSGSKSQLKVPRLPVIDGHSLVGVVAGSMWPGTCRRGRRPVEAISSWRGRKAVGGPESVSRNTPAKLWNRIVFGWNGLAATRLGNCGTALFSGTGGLAATRRGICGTALFSATAGCQTSR
jgi:hypothetical protein